LLIGLIQTSCRRIYIIELVLDIKFWIIHILRFRNIFRTELPKCRRIICGNGSILEFITIQI